MVAIFAVLVMVMLGGALLGFAALFASVALARFRWDADELPAATCRARTASARMADPRVRHSSRARGKTTPWG